MVGLRGKAWCHFLNAYILSVETRQFKMQIYSITVVKKVVNNLFIFIMLIMLSLRGGGGIIKKESCNFERMQ